MQTSGSQRNQIGMTQPRLPNCWSCLVFNSLGGQYITKFSTRENAEKLTGTRTAKTAQAVQVENDLLRQWHQLGLAQSLQYLWDHKVCRFSHKTFVAWGTIANYPSSSRKKEHRAAANSCCTGTPANCVCTCPECPCKSDKEFACKVQQILLQLSGTKEPNGDLHRGIPRPWVSQNM
jgi:hypothetical protein